MPIRTEIHQFDPTIGESSLFKLVDVIAGKAVFQSEKSGWRVYIDIEDPLIKI